MNPSTEKLICAVVSGVKEKGGYVTKTKLLKLLYLLDVEYYRLHRQTFTGFNWKFFHLGPWTPEFDGLIQELLDSEALQESVSRKPDFETKFYRVAEPCDSTGLFASFADEAILLSLLNTWADASTGEILDYVYFHTEPMERGIRNTPLDFTVIGETKPAKYVRPASGASAKEISKRRSEFRATLSKKDVQSVQFEFTLPRYDHEFQKALESIEGADR